MSEEKSLPVHESIANLIRRTQIHEVSLIRDFVTETTILSGHDSIIAAAEVSWFTLSCRQAVDSVRKHVLSEKQKVEAKAAEEKKAAEAKAAAEAEKDRLLDEAEISMTEVLDYFTNSSRPPMDIAHKMQRARNGLGLFREKCGRKLQLTEV